MVTPTQIGTGFGIVLLLYFGFTPLWLYRTIVAILFSGFGAVVPSAPQDNGSLREAMRNVTRDYDQLATLVQEFFSTNSILEPQTEERFQQFLSQKANRSYPKLEGLLDFLLFLYKIAWPFVVMSTAVKFMGKKEAKQEASELLDTLDHVQKKVDDGPGGSRTRSPRSQSSSQTYRTAASLPRQ